MADESNQNPESPFLDSIVRALNTEDADLNQRARVFAAYLPYSDLATTQGPVRPSTAARLAPHLFPHELATTWNIPYEVNHFAADFHIHTNPRQTGGMWDVDHAMPYSQLGSSGSRFPICVPSRSMMEPINSADERAPLYEEPTMPDASVLEESGVRPLGNQRGFFRAFYQAQRAIGKNRFVSAVTAAVQTIGAYATLQTVISNQEAPQTFGMETFHVEPESRQYDPTGESQMLSRLQRFYTIEIESSPDTVGGGAGEQNLVLTLLDKNPSRSAHIAEQTQNPYDLTSINLKNFL